jgi:CubicO group peptidase (beta-lactamase class C family)
LTTRRSLLVSAALAPFLAARFGRVAAQVESGAEAVDATPVATPASATAPDLTGVTPLPLAGGRLATFEAYVATKLEEVGVPGAAVAVIQNGEATFLQGFGVRELERPEPATADTLFRIGSVTKSFSSLLAATLVDAGKVSWETPLVDLLPGFAVTDAVLTPRLTLRDGFCACSGLPRRDFEFIFTANEMTPERLIAGMADLPLTAPHGEKYQYSNQMVAAGGFAAAVAAGGSPTDLDHAFAIALRSRVLNPIGMPRTTYDLTEVVGDGDYASPHAEAIGGALQPVPLLVDDTWLMSVAPSGALWSSARQMVRYVQTELGRGTAPDGARVVSAENLELTWQPGVAIPGAGRPASMAAFAGHYGLGWVVGNYGGQRAVWHSGGTLGFSSLVTFLPDAGLGMVILTNGSGPAVALTYALQFRLFEILFDQPATYDEMLTERLDSGATARTDFLTHIGEVDPAAVAPYLGRYANPALGELSLSLHDGTLYFASGPIRSELRPDLGDDGSVTGYLLVDPPLGGYPPQVVVHLEPSDDGAPGVVITIPDEPGEPDLVYPYAPLATGATPTP